MLRIFSAALIVLVFSLPSASMAQDVATTLAANETASIAPLHGPEDGRRPLPKVLSEQDAALYRRIFAVQVHGDWKEADALISQLGDDLLMGHVLFQRYMHPTKYRSKYLELRDWMASYAEHPGATRIYNLANRRKPANYKSPVRPRSVALPEFNATIDGEGYGASESVRSTARFDPFKGFSRSRRAEARRLQRTVRRWVQSGSVTKAYTYISTPKRIQRMGALARAQSLGVIARGYFRYHLDDKAVAIALEAEKLAGADAPMAHWWGGLAAFRSQEYGRAAKHFEQLSISKATSAEYQAAGAFWASRAYLRARMPQNVTRLLKRAAEARYGFYGLLAIRALGIEPALDWELPRLNEAEADVILRIPAARRAVALIEAGQTDRADSELRRFAADLPPSMAGTLLALADGAGLADLAYRLGREIQKRQGLTVDAALYPLPGWTPGTGFSIDPALIFAFARQESRFRARARSRAGARGLMQLMPATAGFIAKRRFRGAARDELYDPSLNLSLGQRYIEHLLALPQIDGNLFYALTAYNGGPGNLAKWRKKVHYDGDPLLFIESIPSRESRNYVEHVMSNLWIYRHRLGQPSPSMDALIAGRWPSYEAVDTTVAARSKNSVD